jgi:hypothetical protein
MKPGAIKKLKHTGKELKSWSDKCTDMTQKCRTHLFKILNNITLIYDENSETSCVQVSLF